MKSFLLHTSEIDDVAAAVSDISEQLCDKQLHKNSIGIVICHYDYVNNGIIDRLIATLPFPLVGITTFYQDAGIASGLFELTISVLTSDDVQFSVGCDVAGEGTPAERVEAAYRMADSKYSKTPSLILGYLSLNRPISGDEFLSHVDGLSGGVPCFGAVTTGDDESGENIYVIAGGTAFKDGFAVLFLVGEVEARFYSGNFLESSLLDLIATVEDADGSIVKRLNGQPAVTFLEKNGVGFDESDMEMVSTVPFLIKKPGDEGLTARTLMGFTAEGELLFMGDVPVGSRLRVGTVSIEDILSASRDVAQRAVEENADAALLLMYSCVGRFTTLGLESTAELDYVRRTIPEKLSAIGCYAAGEICPTLNSGRLVNRYHNSSFVVCALR